MKSYEFSQKGLQQLKNDEIKRKANQISDVVFYGTIIFLFADGIIGTKFIVTMFLCSYTSKTVKWLIRHNII